jgi:hypothetical protein
VLELGDRAIACQNIRRAIGMLEIDVDAPTSDLLLFDSTLVTGVRQFQHQFHHPIEDGTVGPRTRRLLIWMLLLHHGPIVFGTRLKRPDPATWLFLSYSHADKQWVDELHDWLKQQENLNIGVIQDTEAFSAGATVSENIRRAVAKADKIFVIWSANSYLRDWVGLERAFAEEVERGLDSSLLVYLCLDDTPLPANDETRVAIRAKGKTLGDIKDDILRALKNRGP